MKRLFLLGLLLCANVRAENMLIEAEKFTKAESEVEGYATVKRELAASGKAVLVSVSAKGAVLYDFNVKKPGFYSGWVRYSRRVAKPVTCKLNGRFYKVDCPSTRAKDAKRDSWAWVKLFNVRLSAGQNKLELLPSTWRLDCIYLTDDRRFIPTDEELVTAKERVLTKEERELMDKPLYPLVPDFINDEPNYELPEWCDSQRVQLHTRLGLRKRHMPDESYFNMGKMFGKMGAKVYTRHIKSGGEGAWWPSKTGAIHGLVEKRNIGKDIIDDAHRNGQKIIVYNRHMEDDHMAKLHPDWVCVGPKGNPQMTKRGPIMCMNSPYADYFVKRQLELVEMGADGFYYDEVHMPREGCWCKYCRKGFTEKSGLKHPLTNNHDDPVWHKLKEFNNYTIASTFAKWRKVLHGKKPDLVMLVGSNLWPSTSDKHMDHRAFQITDSHKIEFNKGTAYRSASALWPFPASFRPMELDVRLAYGLDVSRDAADGRPPHVWAYNFKSEEQIYSSTAGMLAHGCIANLDVREKNIPDMSYKSSFELGHRVSPYLSGTKPVRHVAILHSEQARDQDGLDYKKVWKEHLYPIYGAYHVLTRDRVPCGFIFDSQLAQRKFDGIDYLFVPNMENLADELKGALEDFKKSGGTVIENKPDWQWHTEAGWPVAVAEFRKQLANQKSPAQAVGGHEKMQLQAYSSKDGKRLTVCLANDFSWVKVGGAGEEGYVEDDSKANSLKPPACKGVVLKLARKPVRVFEANTGKELKWTADGIEVPDFAALAVIVVEYDDAPAE